MQCDPQVEALEFVDFGARRDLQHL
jgi:hypothetical protein